MTDPVFDKDRPYGDVIGHPHIRYVQNGHNFTAQGDYVPPGDDRVSEERDTGEIRQRRIAAEKEALKEAFKEELRAGTTLQPATPVEKAAPVDLETFVPPETPEPDDELKFQELEDLHWTKLKAMAEDNGLTYKGKAETIKELRKL